ncbi:glycosyltransferase [Natronorarus salvus]|uniref:glycosyltransferase n=1 Tax=Natronorarus salvus TaxID=3117733 RepID=UPI002F25F640
MSPDVGVVVPAYRPDPDRLRAFVESVAETVDPIRLRVELDDPLPETADALSGLPATVNTVPERRGKGRAITEGFDALETEVLAFADADGSTPATSLADVIGPVDGRAVALSVGSRRHPESEVIAHQTVVRRRLGDGFAWLARRLLDPQLTDYQCGAKAIDAALWEEVRGELRAPGFAWDVELVALTHARGGRIVEVPVTWVDAPGSTVAARDALTVVSELIAVGRRVNGEDGAGSGGAVVGDRPGVRSPTGNGGDE